MSREVLRGIYFPALPTDVEEDSAPDRDAGRPRGPGSAQCHAGAGVLSGHRSATLLRAEALIWLWQMFDRSPLGGNVDLGVKFRRLLAPYVFKRVGRNFKAFHFVEVSYGYNLEVGDDVVIHRNVHLDDRGGIVIGDRVSISDYAAVFSHAHSINEINEVTCVPTVVGDDVRITYGAVVLAGESAWGRTEWSVPGPWPRGT